MSIEPKGCCPSTQVPAAKERNFAGVLVGLLRCQSCQRQTGLYSHARTQDEALHSTMVQHVVAVDVDHVTAVRIQRPDTLLPAQQAKGAFGQVEEGANPWVSLVVVVTEGSLVISIEASDAPVGV